jgi:chemotaxis protein histidine kinase CheA
VLLSDFSAACTLSALRRSLVRSDGVTQEIVFTSSERGLRAGSTGFCTVRSTVGMPPNLAALLEQLTGYTHPYDAYDLSLFDKHPVNFAHYISRVGGQKFHILCRICNAPLDHTNRSNKLAHLIALEEGEIDLTHTQGPASAINWMIPPSGKNQESDDSRYWITSWPSNREPCVLPDSKRLVLPSVNDKSGPCTVWKQVLGDSGWAAVLAESSQDRKRQTVPVVFSSEQKDKCLDLVQEALSLLSPAERWGVTFSTFQSGSLPTKVECRWQFLLDSTDLAQKALRNQRRTPVIDLTSLKGSKSPASELTAFTNTGKRPWDRVSVSLSQPVAPKQPAPASSKQHAEPVPATDDLDDDGLDSAADGYRLQKSKSRSGSARSRAPQLHRKRKTGHSRHKGTIGLAAVGLIAAMFNWGMPLLQPKPPNDEQAATPLIAAQLKEREAELKRVESKKEERRLKKERQEAKLVAADEDKIEAARLADQEERKRRELERKKQEEEDARKLAAKQKQENKNKHAATKPDKKPKTPQDPFAGIPKQIKLPEWKHKSSERSKETFMFNVNIQDPSKCELEIYGRKDSGLQEKRKFLWTFENKQGDEYPVGQWTLSCTVDALNPRNIDIAIFRLYNTKLIFRWVTEEKFLADCLCKAGITLTAKNPKKTKNVSFRHVEIKEPMRLPESGATKTIVLLKNVLPKDTLRYVLQSDIAGLTSEHGIKIVTQKTERTNATTIGWAPSPPAVNGTTKIDIPIATIISSTKTLGVVRVRRNKQFNEGKYLGIFVGLYHDPSTKQLELRVTQRLNEPVFTPKTGVTWPEKEPGEDYYYNKLLKFPGKLTTWQSTATNKKNIQPAEITGLRAREQFLKNKLSSAFINANPNKSKWIKELNQIPGKVAVAEDTIKKCRIALRQMENVKQWHGKVIPDFKQLVNQFVINYDLVRDPDSSNPEIVVTSKGSE